MRQRAWFLGILLLALAIAVSAWLGEVSIARLWRGLPLAGNYIAGTIPQLRLDHFLDDLAYWMWGFTEWVWLLADTLLIAYVGTVLGGLIALLLSFPAAATLAPAWVVTLMTADNQAERAATIRMRKRHWRRTVGRA